MHYFKKILSLHFQLWWLLLPKKMLICFMVRKLVADRLSNFKVGCLWRGTSLLFDANSISIITKEGVHFKLKTHAWALGTVQLHGNKQQQQHNKSGKGCIALIGLSRLPQPVSPCQYASADGSGTVQRAEAVPAKPCLPDQKTIGKWCLGEHDSRSARNQKVMFCFGR